MATPANAARVFQEIADRQTPAMRRAYLAAIERIQKAISLVNLATAIERGDIVAVNRAFTERRIAEELREVAEMVRRLTQEAMRVEAIRIGQQMAIRSSMTMTSQPAIDAAAQQAGRLVQGVGRETRLAVRQAIVASLRDGLTPQQTAQRIRQVVGLSARQARALEAFRRDEARRGRSAAQIEAAADRYRQRLLRQRAMLIARTETMSASNTGQQAAWRQAQRDGLLPLGAMRRWIVTPDDRLCPRCSAMRGQEVPIGQPFQSDAGAVMNPPLHPQCRCSQGIVPASIAVARGARQRAAA